MANRVVLLVALVLPMLAQTSRVPFRRCPSDGQTGPIGAPKGRTAVVHLEPKMAMGLAYYQAVGPRVLAPRGWHCFGLYGSSGDILYIAPEPIQPDLSAQPPRGAGVVLHNVIGGGSGTSMVTPVIARVFPQYWPLVRGLIQAGDLSEEDNVFGPYPTDKLIRQTTTLVQFQTPPHSEGLGTMESFKPSDEPIDGLAIRSSTAASTRL